MADILRSISKKIMSKGAQVKNVSGALEKNMIKGAVGRQKKLVAEGLEESIGAKLGPMIEDVGPMQGPFVEDIGIKLGPVKPAADELSAMRRAADEVDVPDNFKPQRQTSWNANPANSFQRNMWEKDNPVRAAANNKFFRKNKENAADAAMGYMDPRGMGAAPDLTTIPDKYKKASEAIGDAAGAKDFSYGVKKGVASESGGLWDRFVDGRGPQKVAGGLLTAWTVQALFGSRGEQSNAELYNQV